MNATALHDLDWLVDYSFCDLKRRDWEWVLDFDDGARLVMACIWRLLENGHVRFTSEDDGQQFGLPAPVNAAAEVNLRLSSATVKAVELRQGTLDLELEFSTGHIFQIIPDSAGYESWQLTHGRAQYIAVGGGRLAGFGMD